MSEAVQKIIDEIKRYDIARIADHYLSPPIKDGKEWVCPACGNGTKDNKTGITVNWKANELYCFACKKSFDALEIVKAIHSGSTFKENVRDVAGYLGIDTSALGPDYSFTGKKTKSVTQIVKTEPKKEPESVAIPNNSLLLTDNNAEDGRKYVESRCISAKTADEMELKFIPNWKPPTSPTAPFSPRIIFPTHTTLNASTGYATRDIRPDSALNDKQIGYTKMHAGSAGISGVKYLQEPGTTDKPAVIFITEGIFDALSVIEHGYKAISLNSTSNANVFPSILDEAKEKGIDLERFRFIDALDSDDTGRNCATSLVDEMGKRDIPYFLSLPDKAYKDINELHIADRAALGSFLSDSYKQAEKSTPKLTETEEYELNQIWIENDTDKFLQLAGELHPPIKTGFYELDTVLGGGLDPERLYILGAGTEIGKTALSMQIADNVAYQDANRKSGHPVLVITLEMSRKELWNRSIARIIDDNLGTYKKYFGNNARSLSLNEIMHGNELATTEYEMVQYAAGYYELHIKPNMYILESGRGITTEKIKETARKIKKKHGQYPFIIIDYLQLMPSSDRAFSEVERLRDISWDCKLLARELGIPVWLLSSFNRTGSKANGEGSRQEAQAALNGSAGIEYSADVALGIYPMDEDGYELKIKLLKGRSLAPSKGLYVNYNGRCSKYTIRGFVPKQDAGSNRRRKNTKIRS